MNRDKFRLVILILVGIVTSQFILSCVEEEIKSSWLKKSITIDGNQMDWQGKLHYLADEHSALGLANDNDNLFLCLATNDTAKIFQFFVTGFTVWFEPQDGGEKIGIQYPLKSDDIRRKMQVGNRSDGVKPDLKLRIDEFKKMQNEFRIVNEDDFLLFAYSLNNEIGIKVDIGYQMGQLVYEIQIPISKSLFGNYNLNLSPKDKVMIAFESGDIDRSELGNFNDGGIRGGGRGGHGGGGGKGSGRSSGNSNGGGRTSGIERIDFKVLVSLAQANE